MKIYIITISAFTMLFFSFLANKSDAGQIYGTITNIRGGMQIQIKLGQQTFYGVTDNKGSYSVYVQNPGQCRFILFRPNLVPVETMIYSYNQPVKYDFDLVFQNNSYMLRRR